MRNRRIFVNVNKKTVAQLFLTGMSSSRQHQQDVAIELCSIKKLRNFHATWRWQSFSKFDWEFDGNLKIPRFLSGKGSSSSFFKQSFGEMRSAFPDK